MKKKDKDLEARTICLHLILKTPGHEHCIYNPEENKKCDFGYKAITEYRFRVVEKQDEKKYEERE